MRLERNLQFVDSEKRQAEEYLEKALLAAEQLRGIVDSTKLASLQKKREAESLSRELARLTRQSFANGNEIADLKEQCDERQTEIERLNEVIAVFQRCSSS